MVYIITSVMYYGCEIKTKDDILYFEIDINGMSEENVEKDQVIMMIVRYV